MNYELVEIDGQKYQKFMIDNSTIKYEPVKAVIKKGRNNVKHLSGEPEPSDAGDGVPSP
jgi:hypothetical protein